MFAFEGKKNSCWGQYHVMRVYNTLKLKTHIKPGLQKWKTDKNYFCVFLYACKSNTFISQLQSQVLCKKQTNKRTIGNMYTEM